MKARIVRVQEGSHVYYKIQHSLFGLIWDDEVVPDLPCIFTYDTLEQAREAIAREHPIETVVEQYN